MQLKQIATVLGAPGIQTSQTVSAINTDSRTLQPGELFIALQGPNFDGHDFVAQAIEKGAVAVVASRALECDVPVLVVPDTLQALWQLADWHRQQFSLPVFAMTGSCGKTSTKRLLSSILREAGHVLASAASYNNNIGVPLTLLQLSSQHQFAVVEMGANHPGEIAQLTALARPTVAIITNAAAAHLEGFKSIEGVSRAKGEIFQGLPGDGMAVINRDDKYADYWLGLVASKKSLTFGFSNNADVYASDIVFNEKAQPKFQLNTPVGHVVVKLQLMGEHNIMNALAAAAACVGAGIELATIQQGLQTADPEAKRLVEHVLASGVTVIDDSYNANPLSVNAAIKTLAQRSGVSVLVLGDMLELGEDSERFHRELGETAQQMGVNHLYCFGEFSQQAADAFGQNAYHFKERELLIEKLKEDVQQDMTILVKGSNSMRMDLVTKALKGE